MTILGEICWIEYPRVLRFCRLSQIHRLCRVILVRNHDSQTDSSQFPVVKIEIKNDLITITEMIALNGSAARYKL